MIEIKKFFWLLLITVVVSYEQIDSSNQIGIAYQQYSYMPFLHVYYDRHFSKSKQFRIFLAVVQQVENRVRKYAKIFFTDCQQKKGDKINACEHIKMINENRIIIGYQPNEKFTNFGDKIMQSPPASKVLDHFSDTYTAKELIQFIDNLVPNFYKQIRNSQEFQRFKIPKYVPKLIFVAPQKEISEAIKKIGIQFFLRFDMAYVEDLTEDVIHQLRLEKFPSLVVLKHNFQSEELEIFPFEGNQFDEDQAPSIRKFLEMYALKQMRQDYLFHFIKMPEKNQIKTIDTKADYQLAIDRIKSWIFVEEGPTIHRLIELKTIYRQYCDYIHYRKPEMNKPVIYLENSREGLKMNFKNQKAIFRIINAQQLESSLSLWLRKNYVVMGVREEFGHACMIVGKPMFASLVHCFIINQTSYEKVTEIVKIKFRFGFVAHAKIHPNNSASISGDQIKSIDFQTTYKTLQYFTKLKVKEIVEDFTLNPVKNLTQSTSVQQLCTQPYKKCVFFFVFPFSDGTNLQYLKLEAIDFMNEFKIYAINISCNKHFQEQIPQVKKNKEGLIAYYPRLNKFVLLKVKMNRKIIKKFLELNIREDTSLPYKTFSSQITALNDCKAYHEDLFLKNKQNQSQQQLGEQL